jgi:transglutaminase-like putative cysteine protease/uncharacterized alpha-E superfamily protein
MTLLTRSAEALYWAGRYLERAEGMARIVLVHADTHVDLPLGEDVGWRPLLAVAGLETEFAQSHPELAATLATPSGPPEDAVGTFLLSSPMNPASILATLGRVREVFRSNRPVIPREAWELANALWLAATDDAEASSTRDLRVGWLRAVIAGCDRLNGTLWGSMCRDDVMAIFRTGQHLERADLTCRLLSVRAEDALADASADPYGGVRAMSVLRSLAAYQQYRRAAGQPGHSLVRFLLQDETFPRTVTASLAQVREHLKELPRNENALAACSDACVLASGAAVGDIGPGGLRVLLGTLVEQLCAVHAHIESDLFADSETEPGGPRPSAGRPAGPGRSPEVLRRYRVVHRTTYRYDAPAEESHNEVHLHPRTTARQRVLSHSIAIDPAPSGRTDFDDPLGNHVTAFLVGGPFSELSVTATSVVELLVIPELPTGPPWESVRDTLERDRRPETRAARAFRAPSRLVPHSPAIAAYAEPSFETGRPIVEAVRDLCARIHRDIAYEPGFTSVTTPLLEVFAARRGVCQDFAHLTVGCLRAVGLAARYVSGYIESFRGTDDPLTGADASHAWVSIYLPGWGWLDLDPTNDLMGCAEHVTCAWGRDYADVSPMRGSVVGGGPAHALAVEVAVTRR